MNDIHRKRRFWLYFILFIVGMLVAFRSGYQLGKDSCKRNNTELRMSVLLPESNEL